MVYLDAYPHIMTLSPEEQGYLFCCLFWYANRIAGDKYTDVTVAAAMCEKLTPQSRMAFYFMADAISRDTLKWREKRKNYQQSAARREEARKRAAAMPFQGRGVDVYPSEEEVKQMEED